MKPFGPWIFGAAILPLLLFALAQGEDDRSGERPPKPSTSNLGDLSIEDLLNIKITSASKKVERVSDTASAIFVITQEDIRRSGATSIPDVLRLVPGVNVAQVDSHTWAVSVRGFQSTLSNKLLVLIDGRSVYSPLYAGVYWDVQDTLLEDIERIEVIRGPGATVWGANAVNGVINIITKDSADTKGGLVTGSVGTQERTIDAVRWGGKIGENINYRVFLKYSDRDDLRSVATNHNALDGSNIERAGTRFDLRLGHEDKVTLEGDYYYGVHNEKAAAAELTPPFTQNLTTSDSRLSGGDVLGRWNHTFSDSSNTSLQMYYDRTQREELNLDQTIDTIDLDFNHHLKLDGHEIVYGVGYRFTQESLEDTFTIAFDPNDRRTNVFSLFGQDEITVLKDKFSITVGSKFEHNDFTGFEIQPSIKMLWHPATNQSVWSSVSRSVRTPEPLETDLRANLAAAPVGTSVALISLFPTHDIPSESDISYELGYRTQLLKRLSIDVAGFYNMYDNLRSNEVGKFTPETAPAPAHFVIPVRQEPFMRGQTYGGEFASTWEPTDRIKFNAGYSFLRIVLERNGNSKARDAFSTEGQTPRNQFHLGSFVDLPHNLQFDSALFYVDRLDNLKVPSYVRVDARLGWRPLHNFDLSIGVQNGLRNFHEEFAPNESKIERNAYLKATFKF